LFGPGCHPWIRLSLSTRYQPYTDAERSASMVLRSFRTRDHEFLAASDFEWTGGHFRTAPGQTTRWWNRLKAWMRREALALPTMDPRVTFWAFPFALALLKRGVPYYSRNWPLDEAIRNASVSSPR